MKAGRCSGTRAAAGALALVASLLVVPVVGGASELSALRGDTPAQAGPPADALTGDAELLGTVDVTASAATGEGIYAHVPVGGISGIDCVDAVATGQDAAAVPGSTMPCLAVSDDPGQRGPVRAYPFDPASGQVGAPVVLTDIHGVPYRPGTVDPESIRLTGVGEDAGMVWSAEGTPTVTVADRTGRARYTLPVADGIRRNRGLEGLAVVPDAPGASAAPARIITATEAAPAGRGHPVVTDYRDGQAVATYGWPGTGISEILADPGGPAAAGGLLVLERGYTPGTGNSSVLWRTRLPGAGSGGRDSGVLSREPVADLGALLGPREVGNTEALAWWRRPDGSRVLLVGTDDNFSDGQRSVVHVIALR